MLQWCINAKLQWILYNLRTNLKSELNWSQLYIEGCPLKRGIYGGKSSLCKKNSELIEEQIVSEELFTLYYVVFIWHESHDIAENVSQE